LYDLGSVAIDVTDSAALADVERDEESYM